MLKINLNDDDDDDGKCSQFASYCIICFLCVYLRLSVMFVSLIKPLSSLKVTRRSFRHASPRLWNQLPTSLRIPHSNYSSPSQRPSFEHAGFTCYTLLSPSITFSLFHSELKTYLFRKSYPPP